jgi:hypothetical protein
MLANSNSNSFDRSNREEYYDQGDEEGDDDNFPVLEIDLRS